MKGFKLVIYYVLQWTWGILQNIIGLIMRFYVLSKDKNKDSEKMRKEKGILYVDFYPEAWANAWGTAITGLPAPKR